MCAEIKKQGASVLEPHQIRFIAETSVDGAPEQPGSLLWVNLFRIYKEALTNIIKHSRAGVVEVTLHANNNGLRLTVQDDGVGLDGNKKQGRGLPNMNRRIREVGGRVAISALQKGTQVVLEVPLPVTYAKTGMEL